MITWLRKNSRLTGRSLKFLVLSATSGLLLIGGTFILHEWLNFTQEVSYAWSLVLVFACNFLALRYIVFVGSGLGFWQQLLGFAASSGLFRLAEYATFLFLHTFLGLYYLLAIVLVSGTFLILKFAFHNWVLFRNVPFDPKSPDPRGKSGR